MLPGFRFLFAATFLTMSILVFGLGAAALLRAAHEQFATNPSWHAGPEATFAQQIEPPRPLLAMLRVGTPATEQKASGDVPGANVPTIAAPAEQAAPVRPPADPATIAALKPEPPALPAGAKSDIPVPDSPAPASPTAAAPSDAPASGAPQQIATPASGDNAQHASTDRALPEAASPPANEAVPAATDVNAAPATAAASPETDIASAKTAALDNPSAIVEMKPPENAASAKPDPSVVKKQLRARRAAHRRRMAARAARLARLAAKQLQQQQAADPFGLRFTQPAAAAIRSRGALEPAPCPNPKTGARFCAIRANQAGPVATGGPSGRPHSDHDPS
ncbi:MAG: hypothetical protein ACXU9D_20115 [Xanthobacteraceae bacterium]